MMVTSENDKLNLKQICKKYKYKFQKEKKITTLLTTKFNSHILAWAIGNKSFLYNTSINNENQYIYILNQDISLLTYTYDNISKTR
jgi:hypothetical protein